MSSGTDAGPPEPGGLQFDRAEFDQAPPSAVSCAACRREVVDRYFEINGAVVCEACKGAIAERLRGGSGFVRFVRAVAFGTAAAAVGALAYAAFIHATHFDLSLVSILVGYLVGRAVRAGSRNRGGPIYQVTAVALTYLSIGATYAALFVVQGELAADPSMPDGVLARVFLFIVLTLVVPILNARANVISIAIIGFALWQAWKSNTRARLVVTGPYRVGEPGTPEVVEGSPAHA